MRRKLTLTIDEEIYQALHRVVPPRHISQFIEDVIRPHIVGDEILANAYKEASEDVERESEADEWIEGVLDGDLS